MKLKDMGLGTKASLIVALTITVIITVIVIIVSSRSNSIIMELAMEEAIMSNRYFAAEVENLQNEAYLTANVIAESHRVANALQSGNNEVLKSVITELGENVDIIMIVDNKGKVLVRSHSDDKGDDVSGMNIVSRALSGTGVGTIEKDDDVGMATRGSAPILDYDEKIIGAVICGHDLSDPKYVDVIKEELHCEATIFLGDTRLNSTLIDEKGNRVIGTQASDAVIETVIKNKSNVSLEVNLFGRDYLAYYSPLIINGEVIGMLFNGILTDNALSSQRSMLYLIIFVGAGCAVAGITIVYVYNKKLISNPLQKLAKDADEIAMGNIEIEGLDNGTAATGNEVIRLERSFSKMIESFKDQAFILARIAEGDYTSQVKIRSDKDVINLAIQLVLEGTLDVLRKVAEAGIQVAESSKQISSGAQSLAQGTTEQAATVQQLSASASDIALKTKENANMADKSAKLADSIKQSAERGSQQMADMISAVNEINEASQSISKVIKTIDDIAFQTNILALNAAVEAARAGQHGKGFAVVAEEVRNLASKSAEAAKDTGELISNSSEKATLGAKIAADTAASLSEIVEGIKESTEIVKEIATSSGEQTLSIEQISEGIHQVAQVVQQNAATAQQSAAASAEMSGQSVLLEELISQFQLKEQRKRLENKNKQ